MGYVKEYFIDEPHDYDEEYFFVNEDYEEYDAEINEEWDNAQLQEEYNLTDLNAAIGIICEVGNRFHINNDDVLYYLREFIKDYEKEVL